MPENPNTPFYGNIRIDANGVRYASHPSIQNGHVVKLQPGEHPLDGFRRVGWLSATPATTSYGVAAPDAYETEREKLDRITNNATRKVSSSWLAMLLKRGTAL